MTNKYQHIYQIVEYPLERGYRMERVSLPNWMHLTISVVNGSKVLTVHSSIHINKSVTMYTIFSTDFTDEEIIKDLSGEISYRYL